MVMSCEEVWREVSNYLDNEVDPVTRAAVEEHLRECKHCTAVMDGTRNIVQLFGDERMLEVPLGFDHRLRRRIARTMPAPRGNFLGFALAAAAVLLIAGSLAISNSSALLKPSLRSQHALPAGSSIPPGLMVVVYSDGKTFHTPECTFIHDRTKARMMTSREALKEGYVPCVRCMRKYLSTTAWNFPGRLEASDASGLSWTLMPRSKSESEKESSED